MANWRVSYCPLFELDTAELVREIPRFRIVPVDNPRHWLAETNPDLPREVQEENAVIMAEALSNALGKVTT